MALEAVVLKAFCYNAVDFLDSLRDVVLLQLLKSISSKM